MCAHQPPCPSADDAARQAARAVSAHPEQGWTLLCNGLIVFDDGGELPQVPVPAQAAPLQLAAA